MAIDVLNRFPSVPIITGTKEKISVSDFKAKKQEIDGLSFEGILRQKTSGNGDLKISKHAGERLRQRNIDLSDNQWQRLETGVKKAELKGIRESLIMVDDVAFIVNVNSNTVITAVDDNDDKVFTNIDGAVIA
ncbi:MAG: flagellar protein [Lachnospiraceae bacterium]|nr:flagellar protein [Lachnospiraceae bacterium]MBR4144653.1 flagellar protein [Lachnospiraceae bacterium]MBR4781838.1 flagellar protein [Lachnospiraceae bacterium]